MLHKLMIRHGGKLITKDAEYESFKQIRIGERISVNSYWPELFPTANFATCLEIQYELVAGTEICTRYFETSYNK